jgi:hypothetical protein
MPVIGVPADRFCRSLQIRYRTKIYNNGYQTYQGTLYRYNIPRHHRLLHGRGSVVPVHSTARIHVLPYIVQDLLFGEKFLKLSSNVQVKVPNIIRTMIPAQIVKQYKSHCDESGFSPISRSTLCRILNVCSASVRKSLQGLDNFSAEGTKAFEELQEIIEKLGDECGEGFTWAKKQNEKLKKAKRYLKTDYKVMYPSHKILSYRYFCRQLSYFLNSLMVENLVCIT